MFFFARLALFCIYFALVAVAGVFICLLRPFNPNNNRLMAGIFSWGGVRLLGIDVQVENAERLKNLPPSVIVANHQSNLDLFVLGGQVPPQTASIGKSSLKWIPFFGQLYWLAGNVLIDRKNAKRSIDAMGQVAEAVVNDNRSIWVFPEGTRSLGRGLGQFKKGAFHIAIQAQCEIIPIAVSSYPGHLKFRQKDAGTVRISVLPPIATEGMSIDDVDELLHRVHLQIADEIARLDGMVKPPVDE